MNLSEEHTAFYYEIGIAITQWAHVERAVPEVIGTCVAQSEFNALGHGFFSIENFRSKVAFADSLLKNTLRDSGHLQDWGGLSNRLTNASKIRNKIAHYCVMGYPAHTEAGRRYCLQPISLRQRCS